MSGSLKFGSENGVGQYNGIDIDANPHMNIIFDNNRNIIHCNPTTMHYFSVSTASEMNAKFYGLADKKHLYGQDLLGIILKRFDEAEIRSRSEFELNLPMNDKSTPIHIVIEHIHYREDFIFIVTGYNLTALRKAETKLTEQDTYLKALNAVGEVLLSAEYDKFQSSMDKSAEIIGLAFGASRVSVCKMSFEEGYIGCYNLCRWKSESEPDDAESAECCIHLPEIWKRNLKEGGMIRKLLSEAEGADAEFLRDNGIKSVTVAPICIKNTVWGCIRLFHTKTEWVVDDSGESIVLSITKLLASGIMKHESTEQLKNALNTNKVILDSNPFNSVMFDEKMNILDYNLGAKNFFHLNNLGDINKDFSNALSVMVPEYQPGGRKSVPFSERLKTAFEIGCEEFETRFILSDKSVYFNVIMRKIIYKGRDAVVTYMFDLTAQKTVQFALEYNDNLLESLGGVADLLINADAKDLEATMHGALEFIGRAAAVDRVYIWKNHVGENGRIYTSQIFEWSPDADPQQGNEFAVNISYDDAVPSWQSNLYLGKCLNTIVKNASPEERAQLEPQGIVSILLAPIFLNGKFWGFIGFDDCHRERVFSIVEENILRICGFMAMVISDTIQNEVATHLLAEREAALISAQVKTNFLANMSHEIRTPMNAILGMTELIIHENTSETVAAHAADIYSACRGLLALINDILDISKIEAGKLKIVPVRYHVSSMLMDVITIIKTRADKKSLDFVVNIDSNIPCELIGDELRIKQVLINLLNNAVKFTHNGQVTLSVTCETENDVCRLAFSVKDTGIGIKLEDMDKVFILFQQIDTRKNRNIEGTGLGLPISRQLAEMMGGSIEMESEYGTGSTFTAVISQTVANSQPVAALKNPGRNSVLVYENRPAYLTSAIYALDSLGCNYRTCANQAEMYNHLDNFECDYIFVSSLHVNKIQDVASQKQPNAIIIILNGDGNMYYKGSMISAAMPIHCLQIANILNDEYDGSSGKIGNAQSANIIAPEAKVLVVDDNAVNLKVAVGLLGIFKIQADTASGGLRAVEMVGEKDYDLVFMDHMMPGMDGIDTTVAIRNLGKKYETLPIIALTANAIGGVREMFKAEGMNDFLAKPVEMSKLNSILKKWLPKDKQKTRSKDAATKKARFEIHGLDTDKGILNSGGIREEYDEILAIYAADCKKRLTELAKYHGENDTRALTICVHALKSASANVGADELSGMAASLEAAGNTGDFGYIDANLRRFTDSLSLLVSNIGEHLESIRKEPTIPGKAADSGILKDALNEIERGMSDMDIDVIEGELEKLSAYQWDDGVAEMILTIKDCIEIFDYSGAEEAAGQLKAKVNEMSN